MCLRYHTFPIQLPDGPQTGKYYSPSLVDNGWQLQGTPVVVEAAGSHPRHVILSMQHVEPRQLLMRGEINGGGELRGGAIT